MPDFFAGVPAIWIYGGGGHLRAGLSALMIAKGILFFARSTCMLWLAHKPGLWRINQRKPPCLLAGRLLYMRGQKRSFGQKAASSAGSVPCHTPCAGGPSAAASGGGSRRGKAVVDQQHHAFVLRRADHPAPRPVRLCSCRGSGTHSQSRNRAFSSKCSRSCSWRGPTWGSPGPTTATPISRSPVRSTPSPNTPPQHRKPHQRLGAAGGKARQKRRALRLVHGGLLPQRGKVRVTGGKILPHRLQVAVTGEKHQVVAGLARRQAGDQVADRRHAGCAVLVAGAYLPGAPQPQIALRERAAQRHGMGVGHAAQVAVIPGRRQRGAKEYRRAPLGKIAGQKALGSRHSMAARTSLPWALTCNTNGRQRCRPRAARRAHQSTAVTARRASRPGARCSSSQRCNGSHRRVRARSSSSARFSSKKGFAKAVVAGSFLTAAPPVQKQRVDGLQCVFQAAFALAQPLLASRNALLHSAVLCMSRARPGRLCASSMRNR